MSEGRRQKKRRRGRGEKPEQAAAREMQLPALKMGRESAGKTKSF